MQQKRLQRKRITQYRTYCYRLLSKRTQQHDGFPFWVRDASGRKIWFAQSVKGHLVVPFLLRACIPPCGAGAMRQEACRLASPEIVFNDKGHACSVCTNPSAIVQPQRCSRRMRKRLTNVYAHWITASELTLLEFHPFKIFKPPCLIDSGDLCKLN